MHRDTRTDIDNKNLFLEFSNEIDDLPPPNTYVRKKFAETPEEIQVELDRTREMREGEFRQWLIKNKPKKAVMTAIETSTATGVPDLFCCYDGVMSWIECKIILAGAPRIRGTQYVYLKKLVAAGGIAKIVVQKLSNVTYKPSAIKVYDAADITAIPVDMFKHQGQEMIFPPNTQPWYEWQYNRNKRKETVEDLFLHLLLDTRTFA